MRRTRAVRPLLPALPLALSACVNTLEGIGDDLEAADGEIERATG